MHRLLLGCFLPLLLLLPAQAQPYEKALRTSFSLAGTPWVSTLSHDVQQVVDKVLLRQAVLDLQAEVYHLVQLPDQLPTPIQLPAFPLPKNANNMYRGMALDSPNEQLRHIWEKGLEVDKCQFENFASYDGKICAGPAVYASSDPDLALGYTNVRLNDESNARFPVLFHLKRLGNSLTVSIPHDVPPQWIERVSTVLKVNGQLRWGELKLDERGQFLFIPYPLKNPIK